MLRTIFSTTTSKSSKRRIHIVAGLPFGLAINAIAG